VERSVIIPQETMIDMAAGRDFDSEDRSGGGRDENQIDRK
jgi:hypothetical protein